MKQHVEEEAELRKYLLGELSPEEQVSVEARLFLEDEYLSQLRAVEDELIDAYAYEELAADERAKVEARLLSRPGRREDLSLTRALNRYVPDDDPVTPPVTPAPADLHPHAEPASGPDVPPPRRKDHFSFFSTLFAGRPVVAYAFAAAALIILSVIIWFSMQTLSGRPSDLKAHEPTPQQPKPNEPVQPGGELQANQHPPGQGVETPRREGPTRNGSTPREKEERAERREEPRNENAPAPRPAAPRVATFLILPGGVVRGPGGTKQITISADVGVVVLRLPLVVSGDYQRFRATLQDGGRVVYTKSDLKPEADAELDSKVVLFKVPARLLREGRYEVKVGGVTADGQTREVNSYTVPVERH